MKKLLPATLLFFGLTTIFVLTTSLAFADTWKKPACASGDGDLEKRSNSNHWRCKKHTNTTYRYKAKGTSPRQGRCNSIAGIGYHWAKRSGIWKCCGTSPLGETCKAFTGNVTGIQVGSCPKGFDKQNTGDGNKVCRRSQKSYTIKNPIWVN
jgi:hypothetical protein